MAPLPANSTARMFFDYVSGGAATSQEHTLQWRYIAAPDTDTDVQLAFLSFLESLGEAEFATGWQVIRVRKQAANTLFSVPVVPQADLLNFEGSGGSFSNPANEALEWTWQSRSPTTGRRQDFSLYGLFQDLPQNFRLQTGDLPWVGASVANLNAGVVGPRPRAIDGSGLSFYSYVNANYNSYWERRVRSL